ncbi:methylenetetrahydrofolate reductase [NAD(P)H] [Gilvimarinus sp. SDUM040013]|uniref:Methylenetetrahydrofolate reductase n=1 Tax=Gilvimarinus gilvus TaxID=3058038 RepID=A0ABU4RV85_9GAMM|nr:methylenetetrahydrofolate reductase [NAD(P)H] [Gilvimarinus sp. SDUM040013]MDO3388544.1 methylenetetrahydrofolate reductase [NAD(P)H] [Gilvimarinus sp. SDUM040013]MDX6848584.1 methylenetetrahydrofolate reductase [NAD(P)H] [Gilvimarinus sp. SDUM040013]
MSEDTLRLSFEFFPPKTEEGKTKLTAVREKLAVFAPDFFSVTYGAGGSTRDNTKNLVTQFNALGTSVAPHLSFGGDDEATIKELIEEYRTAGIERIVALRGDMPSGVGGSYQLVYANELVAFIRQHFGDAFELEVAAYPEIHPQAKSYDDDVRYLKGKFDAGADNAITQYFYNPDAYFYFMDACAKIGIENPIYPGIMPIINYRNLTRFSDSCGADIPRWLRRRLESFEHDPEALRDFGEEVVTELCETLLEGGAPGLHFYTMNQSEPVASIVRNLGLDDL